MSYNKHKDLDPVDTIKKAQNILKSLGIDMDETIHHPTDSLWSMRLQSKTLQWGTNGKGTTEDFCRASAYGEALERLQNLHLPDWLLELKEPIQDLNFEFYQDEVCDELQEATLHPDLKNDMMQSYYEAESKFPTDDELYSVWCKWNESKTFRFIPFYSIKQDKIVKFPYEVVRRLCRSNGIASGNTLEEAICQALSEILERYVQKHLFIDELTPPIIDNDYIKNNYPELYDTIKEIENKGSFKLLVFDGSLGKQIPVLCVVLIDYEYQRYRVKFGSHPCFVIALERCLTELAQGNDFSSTSNEIQMTHWDRESWNNWNTFNNWSKMFRSNIGAIPSSIFFTTPSWTFEEWSIKSDFNNKKGVEFLLSLCLSLAPDVYIRDNSFLGFPSVRIYVPGMSPVYKFNPLSANNGGLSRKMRNIIYSFPLYAESISKSEKLELIKIFTNDYHSIYSEMLGVSVPVLLGTLYYDVGDIQNAIRWLHKELKPSKFIMAAIRELEMQEDNISIVDRDRMLSLFFGDKFKTYIAINWRGANATIGLFDPFRVSKLRGVKLDNTQLIEKITSLYNKLKQRMRDASISQVDLQVFSQNRQTDFYTSNK